MLLTCADRGDSFFHCHLFPEAQIFDDYLGDKVSIDGGCEATVTARTGFG